MTDRAPLPGTVSIRAARESDVPHILALIRELAAYEHLEHQVVATEPELAAALFAPHPYAEVVLAWVDRDADGSAAETPVGFALFFHNFSTFLGRPGIYLEDLFVRPPWRRYGIGRRLFVWLAHTALTRGCGRLEWAVLDWNQPAIGFYKSVGAVALDEWKTFRLSGAALERMARARNDR
jgi:GNAT superfamily N-acetyltransferase